DSEWFTNRHGISRMSRAELQRGPISGRPPVAPFTVVSGKSEGVMAGFTMRDSEGRRYFVKGDPLKHPEMATAADAIVSRFLHAIGYNIPKYEILDMKLSDLRLSHTGKITLPGGRSREMTPKDIEAVVRTIPHRPDGSFRVVSSLAIDGEIIG